MSIFDANKFPLQKILLIFLFVILFVAAKAQQQQQPYLFNHLGTSNGLVSDEVMGLQQDKDGYIWIATLEGLQRYDGSRFLNFKHNPVDKLSIPNNMVEQVVTDKQNRLWLRFGQTKIGYFSTADFTFHEVPVKFSRGILNNAVSTLVCDQQGNIMVVLENHALLTYKESAHEFSEQYNLCTLPKNWHPLSITQDKFQFNYWIGCDSGLVKYSTRDKTLSYRGHNVTADPIIKAYADLLRVMYPCFDRNGKCWIWTWSDMQAPALYSYQSAGNTLINWVPSLKKMLKQFYMDVRNISEKRDGSIWIVGPNTFAKFDNSSNHFDIINNNLPGEFSIRYDEVRQVYEDREENLWACTNKGLFRFNPSAQFFRSIVNQRVGKDKAYTPDVTHIIQTQDSNILVSTWGNGTFSYDKNFQATNTPSTNQSLQLAERLSWCLLQRKNGDIWKAHQDAYLYIYHAATNTTERIQPPIFGKSTIRQIVEDKNGNVWLGTQRGYVVKWDATTNQFSLVQQCVSIIEKLYVDRKNNVWACTENNGVFAIGNNGKLLNHYIGEGSIGKRLSKPYAFDMLQYNDSLYIIVGGGLNFLNIKTNRFTYSEQSSDYPTNTINNIVKDRKGILWLTSQSGISSIDLKKQITITYNERDGVYTNGFTSGSACLLADGRIAFGTRHDVFIFDPAKIDPSAIHVAPIHITGFSLMNKWLLMDSLNKLKLIELPHDENSVVIEFSTLTYQNSFTISYKLEGLDKDWRRANGSNRAVYSYIPPGTYKFLVKSEDGVNKAEFFQKELSIKVKAPFWKTWWFLSLMAFAVIGFVSLLDKFRLERAKETERVRTRIATSLTSDMSNALSSINVLSEMAKNKVDKDIDRTKDYIDQISNNSQRMMEVMDDMVWSINPQNDSIDNTLKRMRKYAAEVQSKYDIEVNFNIDDKVNQLELNMDRRHELYLVFKEALQNAGKHSKGKFADVDIIVEKSQLKMTITDNGNGFNVDAANFGRGMNEMRKRAYELKGSVKIESEVNNGTVVRLEMPIG